MRRLVLGQAANNKHTAKERESERDRERKTNTVDNFEIREEKLINSSNSSIDNNNSSSSSSKTHQHKRYIALDTMRVDDLLETTSILEPIISGPLIILREREHQQTKESTHQNGQRVNKPEWTESQREPKKTKSSLFCEESEIVLKLSVKISVNR